MSGAFFRFSSQGLCKDTKTQTDPIAATETVGGVGLAAVVLLLGQLASPHFLSGFAVFLCYASSFGPALANLAIARHEIIRLCRRSSKNTQERTFITEANEVTFVHRVWVLEQFISRNDDNTYLEVMRIQKQNS